MSAITADAATPTANSPLTEVVASPVDHASATVNTNTAAPDSGDASSTVPSVAPKPVDDDDDNNTNNNNTDDDDMRNMRHSLNTQLLDVHQKLASTLTGPSTAIESPPTPPETGATSDGAGSPVLSLALQDYRQLLQELHLRQAPARQASSPPLPHSTSPPLAKASAGKRKSSGSGYGVDGSHESPPDAHASGTAGRHKAAKLAANAALLASSAGSADAALSADALAATPHISTTTAVTFNLLQFVRLILQIRADMFINADNQLCYSSSIGSYLFEQPLSTAGGMGSSPSSQSPPSQHVFSLQHVQARIHQQQQRLQQLRASGVSAVPKEVRIYRNIVFDLFTTTEEYANVTLQFSKEALKYFLATYWKFINANDFIDTNRVVKTDKKTRNNSQLALGAILSEYIKGLDSFISNMNRFESSDVDALKMIISNRIQLPMSLYRIPAELSFSFNDVVYHRDETYVARPHCIQIPISNFKRITLLITDAVLMIYDGNQFIVPSINIEKDFQTRMYSCTGVLKPSDYIILDVLSITKNKVIDIIDMRIRDLATIPERYVDRLSLIERLFAGIKTVNLGSASTSSAANAPSTFAEGLLKQQQQQPLQTQFGNNTFNAHANGSASNMDTSCIQKLESGFGGPTYIYHKSNLIAAAVGICERHVLLAFRQRPLVGTFASDPADIADEPGAERTLTVKTKASISGALTCLLMTVGFQSDAATAQRPQPDAPPPSKQSRAAPPSPQVSPHHSISLGGETWRVEGVVPSANLQLFQYAVPVELKDGFKLGNLSKRPVSFVSDYRPVTVVKEQSKLDAIEKSIHDPMFVHQLVEMLVKNNKAREVHNVMSMLHERDVRIDHMIGWTAAAASADPSVQPPPAVTDAGA